MVAIELCDKPPIVSSLAIGTVEPKTTEKGKIIQVGYSFPCYCSILGVVTSRRVVSASGRSRNQTWPGPLIATVDLSTNMSLESFRNSLSLLLSYIHFRCPLRG